MQFEIHTSAKGPIAVAVLQGRLDAANSRQLRQQFEESLKTTNRFVLDCKRLDFIDSTGLGALISCLRKALAAGGDIRLAGITSKVRMIFQLTQAEKLFSFFSDADQALVSFTDQPA